MSNKTLIISIVVLLLIFGGVAAVLSHRSNKPETTDVASDNSQPVTDNQLNPPVDQTQQQAQPAASTTPASSQTCMKDFDQKKFDTAQVNTHNRQVTIEVKGFGNVVLALDDTAAPKTVENFLKLANSGFYDCLTFHRIIPGFVVQGGDPKGDGTGGPGFTVPAEIKLLHKRGAIATARLGDDANPKRDSSGSQFYIALQDLPQLDGQYTVFGNVISGMDVVDKIAAVQTNQANGMPTTPVVMEKVTISK